MKIKFKPTSIILILAVLLMIVNTSRAQTVATTYQLSGKIVDSVTHQLLSLITIRLKDNKGEPARAMVTRDSGTFAFSALNGAHYGLSIVAIGYQPKNIDVNLSGNINLGDIYLKEQQTSLKEVTIMADRPMISQKADRIVYDLHADPESKGTSVLGMMRKVPFISLDGNDNILVKGNSSYKVLINGKPSSMVNGNLTAILRSMPASTIQKIEVITVPPAKYDAEGLAGIINIITNKKVNDGYNGTLNINESFPAGGPGVGGSFTAKAGKFGLSAFGGGSIYNNPQTNFSNSVISSGSAATNLEQSGLTKSNTKNGYLGSQLSYEIDSLNLISGQFNINGNRSNGSNSLKSFLTGSDIASQGYNLMNNNSGSSYGIDAAINYQLGFKAVKNRFLTFSYMYSTNPGNQNANIGFSNLVNMAANDYRQKDNQKFSEQTVQVDFVTPLKMVNMEAGVKGIFRKNSSDFRYNGFNSSTGDFEFDPALSDNYYNSQNVFSAYNSYQLSLNSWNITAGVRLEQTAIRANFVSSASVADQNYLNVIPSAAVGKNFADQSSINFGFSQRIRRPGINRLNPYIDRSNPNIQSTGNPALRPVLLNDIQAGYSSNKKLSVNIGLDYSFMNNLDLKVTHFDPASQISTTSYANVGKAKSLGANVNIGYPVAKWYNVSLNGNLMYLWLAGPGDGVVISNNRYIYFAALSNGFQVGEGWRINADLNVISRNPNGLQGTSNGMVSTAFGVNKELIKNKLGFAATIKNPVTKYRNNQNQTFGPNFSQFSTSRDYYRSFSISLNYSFGGLRDGINKSKSEIRNDDLSN
ncbi:TonB-dependent receptor [Mucilaginibacter sp. BJC16-A38]|uniref:outer membrane beta-barrel protein n=1 Tax=Mucilaginibacter phenanthrenivorans TaxID=1234842 RepID=UPI002157368A|nr:outer membrane beta-barrel protein [Mucilaginibacter phenanthrenivorans]MCR8557398.1 TonB-dependent receptor [Mucilaginibacter phenanthrenivorans]